MAYYAFTRAILAREPIEVFGDGELTRDFTYIDDITDGLIAVLDRPPDAPRHRVLNIGAGRPQTISALVKSLETLLGVKAKIVAGVKPAGDVPATFADVTALTALTGYAPKVDAGRGP